MRKGGRRKRRPGGCDSVTGKSGLEGGEERKIGNGREEESRNGGQDGGGGVERKRVRRQHHPPRCYTSVVQLCSVTSDQRMINGRAKLQRVLYI